MRLITNQYDFAYLDLIIPKIKVGDGWDFNFYL